MIIKKNHDEDLRILQIVFFLNLGKSWDGNKKESQAVHRSSDLLISIEISVTLYNKVR